MKNFNFLEKITFKEVVAISFSLSKNNTYKKNPSVPYFICIIFVYIIKKIMVIFLEARRCYSQLTLFLFELLKYYLTLKISIHSARVYYFIFKSLGQNILLTFMHYLRNAHKLEFIASIWLQCQYVYCFMILKVNLSWGFSHSIIHTYIHLPR